MISKTIVALHHQTPYYPYTKVFEIVYEGVKARCKVHGAVLDAALSCQHIINQREKEKASKDLLSHYCSSGFTCTRRRL